MRRVMVQLTVEELELILDNLGAPSDSDNMVLVELRNKLQQILHSINQDNSNKNIG